MTLRYHGNKISRWQQLESLCNGDCEQQKTIGLDWQKNIFARASRFFVHFLAVVARPRHETVVPKSYRPKGQSRSTRNEFPIRADFGNYWKHPIWRLKCGENWQPKEPFYRQGSVIYGIVDEVCMRLLWLLQSSWTCIVSNPFITVLSVCLVPLAGITEENSTVGGPWSAQVPDALGPRLFWKW